MTSTAYTVKLAHAKNPDVPGGYWDGKPTEGAKTITVTTLREASAACTAYINRNGLGGGNWSGGQVFVGKQQVARVSYNGRVWNMDGTEAA